MNWGPTFRTRTDAVPADCGLPRKVLRHLIRTSGVGIGSRVLNAGSGGGELSEFLSALGMRVSGLADRAEEVVAARRDFPEHEMKFGNLPQSVPYDEQTFQLVLARDLSAHCGALQTSTALRATAQLLSCVRPGGSFSFVQRIDASAAAGAAGHGARCYERHLGHFPGTVQAVEFADGVMPRAPWHRLVKAPQATGLLAVTLRIPSEPLERGAWLRLADDFARTVAQPCCEWAAELQSYRGLKVA
jgi:SAM-dependent methyltransferase